MLYPKKTHFKKPHQKCHNTKETRTIFLSKGIFGLKSLQNKELNLSQIESIKKVFLRKINRLNKIWLNLFVHFSKTKKPLESRMGKGKGVFIFWYFFVKTGRIIFEFDTYENKNFSSKLLKKATKKLPFRTKIIFKNF